MPDTHGHAQTPPMLIRGGRVIDPASGTDQTADVLIDGGIVRDISAKAGGLKSAGREAIVIDAEGCIVAPGLVDMHVHVREPSATHRETISSGAAAAAAGGFTTICCMPNTTPPLDSAAWIEFVAQKSVAAGSAQVFAVGCATRGRAGMEPADLMAMARAGAVGFTDDGDCVADTGVLANVLRTVAAVDRVFMQHCQDPTLTRGASMNAGVLATRLGLGGWPAAAEEIVIERDVRLNRAIGCRYHAQHVSSGDSVEIIRRAQRERQPVTGEVSPHHLLLTEDACDGYNTAAKMNPPLRTKRDIDLLKAGVADGTITVLATDHAPHLPEAKALDFAAAPFGISCLDCALPLYVMALIEDGVTDWPSLLAMMTVNPARLTGLDRQGIGSLKIGGPADLTVIDPELAWTIDVGQFKSAGRNCPFDGWKVRGRAIATIARGTVIHRLERETAGMRPDAELRRQSERPVAGGVRAG